MHFKDLPLHPNILQAVEQSGYLHPTPIQKEAIPLIAQGHDLRASAQTGSGKTAAFMLPILGLLATPSPGRGPRILILVPTRELAMQVSTESIKYSKYLTRVKTVCIYGGTPYPPQNKMLSQPYDILVATPGRLIDHMKCGRIHFSRLQVLVLDEADRMLDMGFIESVNEIAKALPQTRQTLLFSATLKGNVLNLSNRLLKDPKEIHILSTLTKQQQIEERFHHVDNLEHKYRLLDHLLNDPALKQAIIFTATKYQASQLADKLYKYGHQAATLHGDMTQRQRTRTLTLLRQGKIDLLIATDVAARGLDIHSISHVFNFDIPRSPEDYVHRIGRTGRAGSKGIATTFATYKEMSLIKRIEQFTGYRLPFHIIAGMEPISLKSPRKAMQPKKSRNFKQNRRQRVFKFKD